MDAERKKQLNQAEQNGTEESSTEEILTLS
jgi:hypothetical protein